MQRFLIRRFLFTIPVVFFVLLLVFLSLHLAPGDPMDLLLPPDSPWTDAENRDEYIQHLRARWGLDLPLHQQFLKYLSNLARLDFGRSLYSGDPIIEELLPRYQATLELTFAAMIVAISIGLSVGVISAIRANSLLDSIITTLALGGVSIPSFWLGLILMLIFALYLRWLPPSGRPAPVYTAEGFKFIILPALTLGLSSAGILVRITRSQMLEVLGEDYVRTARAKGLREQVVVFRHALRTALIPIVTVLGLQFGGLLAGAVVAETVFAYPGVGRYLVQAVTTRDFPAVQSGVLFVSLTFVLVNLFVDVIYALLDPRIRYESG
jgi:peptide/nickel transport system permease protein